LLFRKAAALHALVLVVGQNELQTGLNPRGKVNSIAAPEEHGSLRFQKILPHGKRQGAPRL
ncbi:hypothetical protein, partial [Bradyrhizobium sp. S3.2.12]|uniref:hypothetical protein n=1 Tax=Bradyrhizobium sp. S3.2.12 TaxID=3156387 RepID=UPI0033919337